jgi:hypothetical protein
MIDSRFSIVECGRLIGCYFGYFINTLPGYQARGKLIITRDRFLFRQNPLTLHIYMEHI